MYVPEHFAEHRLDVLHQLMHDHPLGTLVTLEPDGLNACHIPFEIAPASAAAPHGTLRAHIARNNPLWRNASTALDALVVFQGPQAYITPSWYEEKKVSGSWKASQNRSAVDRSTIAAGLRASGDADAVAMAGLVAG
ncbi:MAG: FMN-binding negative transcriptional regulator [Oxalobacteraceae bacterium]